MEDAEDSETQGAKDVAARRVNKNDVVVGISSSGTTPYVLGALRLAKKRGAATIGITANRNSPISKLVQLLIAAETGPELIAGSTRMKAGTAQKLILNTLTTGAFVLLGRVYNNWMVDVSLSNRKLRERGLRILQEATGANKKRAATALAQSGDKMRVALIMLKTGVSATDASRRLKQSGNDLRLALGEKLNLQREISKNAELPSKRKLSHG
jgi:N-acetylmuramic acid 6-phosphate etherase